MDREVSNLKLPKYLDTRGVEVWTVERFILAWKREFSFQFLRLERTLEADSLSLSLARARARWSKNLDKSVIPDESNGSLGVPFREKERMNRKPRLQSVYVHVVDICVAKYTIAGERIPFFFPHFLYPLKIDRFRYPCVSTFVKFTLRVVLAELFFYKSGIFSIEG